MTRLTPCMLFPPLGVIREYRNGFSAKKIRRPIFAICEGL
jgi:hypothetical protein